MLVWTSCTVYAALCNNQERKQMCGSQASFDRCRCARAGGSSRCRRSDGCARWTRSELKSLSGPGWPLGDRISSESGSACWFAKVDCTFMHMKNRVSFWRVRFCPALVCYVFRSSPSICKVQGGKNGKVYLVFCCVSNNSKFTPPTTMCRNGPPPLDNRSSSLFSN